MLVMLLFFYQLSRKRHTLNTWRIHSLYFFLSFFFCPTLLYFGCLCLRKREMCGIYIRKYKKYFFLCWAFNKIIIFLGYELDYKVGWWFVINLPHMLSHFAFMSSLHILFGFSSSSWCSAIGDDCFKENKQD